jgi:hypothetical protein
MHVYTTLSVVICKVNVIVEVHSQESMCTRFCASSGSTPQDIWLEAMRRGELATAPYTADNFTTVQGAMAAAGTDWVEAAWVQNLCQRAESTRKQRGQLHRVQLHQGGPVVVRS